MLIHYDCRHFQGHVPCGYHKSEGVHCDGCEHYDQVNQRILIIKLGAMGDVIRTTPLIEVLKKKHPGCQIFWLTLSTDILPDTVDKKLAFTLASILFLEEVEFDVLINLDKDVEACALAKRISAKKQFGYSLIANVPAPVNQLAEHKFHTGLFDDIGQTNTKSYPEEMFEIIGETFSGEKYTISSKYNNFDWSLPAGGKLIGLNTGCGTRWTTRQWPEQHWIDLSKQLLAEGYRVLLLGGPEEDELNKRIQAASGALYLGTFPLLQFVSLMNQCDLIVTLVTMALHVALALEKQIILMNNIFNRHEFDMFGLGDIIEPPVCTCYFAQACDKNCMDDLLVADIYKLIINRLPCQ